MSLTLLAGFALASVIIVVVPGPTVTVIVANALRDGTRAGLLNVAGTQTGLVIILLVVALGLETVVAVMGQAFVWVKLAGAAYLIWLGIKLLRSSGEIAMAGSRRRSDAGYFWQGFLVILSNPKVLVLFGAFIPQFIDPHDAFRQTMILGLVFMAVATFFDSLYALAAGKAGVWLTRKRVRVVEVLSGMFLIGGGIWLAALRRA
jgi:threonine/homoserine/homoserine lactone efflux protein